MSSGGIVLLAVAADIDLLRSGSSITGKSTGLVMQDILLIIAAVLALTLVLVLAISYWAKHRRHHSHHRHRRRHHHHERVEPTEEAPLKSATSGEEERVNGEQESQDEDEDEDKESATHHNRHRHRRRIARREHRQRNPTLAETGGLPPVRSPDAPPPPI